MASCRSCNAPIEWAEFEASGKPCPLDAEPVANGNLVLLKGKVRKYTDEDARLGRERRASHFATCKDATQWRK